jgi:hypothetical protein
LQRKIKEAAEALGFSGTIEKDVLGGTGFVDVSLKLGDLSIACEISHSTPGDHEVENVRKCLAAGYSVVIAVAQEKQQLHTLARAVAEKLPEGDQKRVQVSLPSRVTTILKRLLRQAKGELPVSTKVAGYTIKRKYSSETAAEQGRAAENAFLRIVAKALRGE